MSRSYAVVYDGTCNVCTKFINVLQRLDKRSELEILTSPAPELAQRFPWIPEHAYTESIQVIRLTDGRTWQGAAAVEELLDVLPKGRFVTWIFSVPFVRPLAERFYRWFARRRYRFGCSAHCQVTVRDR